MEQIKKQVIYTKNKTIRLYNLIKDNIDFESEIVH